LQVEGAQQQETAGGQSTSARRTIYYFQPDGDEDGVPTYEGSSWPVVFVPPGAQVSVAEDVHASVTQGAGGVLLVDGRPVYQYTGDTNAEAANGNQLVTIRWMMSHIYADPAILQGVREEVRAKLAEKGEGATLRSFTLDDLLDLKLTQACLTEAVRLHSDIPSKLTLRSAEVDLKFGGYEVPKGSTIFLYADAVHKDDRYFPKAGEFCPHRYTDKAEFTRMNKDNEIVAFGHGRKRCTGEAHARSQISALLASFVQRFDR